MKFSELKGRAVVSLDDATKIGAVEDLMVEPVSRQILGLKVRTGRFSSAQMVPVADVKNVGADAVTLTTNSMLASTAPDGKPTGPDSSVISPGAVELTGILGTKVVTDAGTLVGQLSDVLLDWSNMVITGYEVRANGMFAKAQEFAATPDVRFGDKIITIPAQLLSQPA